MLWKYLILFVPLYSISQQPIGSWRSHIPMSTCNWVGETDDAVYGVNKYGILVYSKIDESVSSLTKISGLTQSGISSFNCDSNSNTCIIGYENGNLDIIDSANFIVNQPAILNSQWIGSKSVNEISFYNNKAYLSTDIGLVIIDLHTLNVEDHLELKDGDVRYPAICSTVFKDSIFVVGSSNVFRFELKSIGSATDPQILFYTEKQGKFRQLWEWGGELYATYKTNLYNQDTLYKYTGSHFTPIIPLSGLGINKVEPRKSNILVTHSDAISSYLSNFILDQSIFTYGSDIPVSGMQAKLSNDYKKVWIADINSGLIKSSFTDQYNSKILNINSPQKGTLSRLSSTHDAIIVLPGGQEVTFLPPLVSRFKKNFWTNAEIKNQEFTDFTNGNEAIMFSNKYYICSNRGGLAILDEFLDLEIIYNENNSPIEDLYPNSDYNYYGITSIAKDNQNNIFLAQNKSHTPIKVMLSDGTWTTFSFKSIGINDPPTNDILITSNGLLLANFAPLGILVCDFNGTPEYQEDDQYKLLTTSPESGNLPNQEIICMREDKDGAVWLGTEEGISVIYSLNNVFSGNFEGAQKIIVKQDNYNGYLFESEAIQALEIDEANRKWVGTRGSGVFLISSDGLNQILHFTSGDSPILDDEILDIAIHPVSGEVFIITQGGLVSYRSDATESSEDLSGVRVFPNPVKPGYDGPIAISNVTSNALVRVTDISGNLIYETQSEGGQAIWPGTNMSGSSVAEGIYLIHISSENGLNGTVEKLLYLR